LRTGHCANGPEGMNAIAPLTSDLSDAFFRGVVDLCGRLRIDPFDLLGVMLAESQVRADAWNARTDAGGLIQLLPSALADVGWAGPTEEFRRLNAAEQLPYVEAYLQPYVHFGLGSAARLYQVV